MIRAIFTILFVCLFALANSGATFYVATGDPAQPYIEITQLPTSLITFQTMEIKVVFTDAMGHEIGHKYLGRRDTPSPLGP